MDVNEGTAAAVPTEHGAVVREKLLARRARLESARAGLSEADRLARLLREVDEALARIANGTFGLCEVCRDPIEADRLSADPLLRNCLDHLTRDEQRALEQDLDLAGRIQHGLLPKKGASFDGWDTHYFYEPLGAASGDYCDLIGSGPGSLIFLLGDVSGKGVAASVLMSHLHAIFRSLVPLPLACAELVERANRIFCESTGGDHYATLVCGIAAGDGEIEICNAGHCPPVWIRESGATTLPATGVPLGLFCRSPYSTTRVALARGETLLLYTDGVTEARNPQDLEYGPERLVHAITGAAHASAADLVARCRAGLTAFRDGRPRTDDVTILAVRRPG